MSKGVAAAVAAASILRPASRLVSTLRPASRPVSISRPPRLILLLLLLQPLAVRAEIPLRPVPPEDAERILALSVARHGNASSRAPLDDTFLSDDDFNRPLNDDQVFLTEQDFENGEKLASQEHLRADGKSAPHLLARQAFHRGDIRGKASWRLKTLRAGARRNGVISSVKKWPAARIPYALSGKYNDRERAVLARSFSEYHKRTCIRFVPRTALDNDYLYIGKIDGCYSDVGRAGGRQELSLDDGCLQYDTAIHELMHSVGFYHEHERWDRDQHISILWQNIDKDAYDQFGKVDLSESSYYGQAYDYYSVMHYDSLAFSKNGFETMVAKRPEMTKVIGSAIDFSPIDILKINLMYGCTEATIGAPPSAVFSSLAQSQLPVALPPASILPQPLPPPSSSVIDTAAAAVALPPAQPLPPIVAPIVPKSVVSTLPLAASAAILKPSEEGLPATVASSDDCRDKTNLCWRWLDRCRSFFFEKIMKEFCALSCGYCSPESSVTPPKAVVARAEPPLGVDVMYPFYRQIG